MLKEPYIEQKAIISQLLHRIKNLQSLGSSIYPEGLFPSQRYHTALPYRREDSNVFFTAITVFTLQGISKYCSGTDRELIKTIADKAIAAYPLYKSRKGLFTYNFWQTTKNKQFPHGYLLNRLKFLELPDDVDDTALIYLTKTHTEGELLGLKQELENHANLSKKQSINTLPKYRNLKAYTTWFGKNMYLEFDFCVLCNLLYCLRYHQLPFTQHDKDTVSFLREVILSSEHISKPFQVAPSYPRTALILYHLSRLMAAYDIPGLTDLRGTIVDQLNDQLKSDLHFLDKILLASSIAKLTGTCPYIPYSLPINHKDYFFFNGGMMTAFENPWARKLAPLPAFHMKHTCEAYYLALLVEYEVLRSLKEAEHRFKVES